MDFSLNGKGITAAVFQTVDKETVWFRAEQIRRERTGIHAKISILIESTLLAWSQFNVERDEERTRITNKAHAGLAKGTQEIYEKRFLAHDMDIFCHRFWDEYLGLTIPTLVVGNPVQEPVSYITHPFVIDGGGTILFGPPGRGKSYTALLMAVSVDAGVNDLWVCKPRPALYINLERSGSSLARRLGCVNTALGLAPERPLAMLNVRGRSLLDIRDLAAATVEKYGVRCIVLDSISRAGYGSLVEDRPVNAIVDALNSLGDTWLALAHTPRQDETHLFGSIHFEAGADVVVQLLSQLKGNTTLGIGLQITKANDMPKQGLKTYSYEFDEYGLCAARKARPREFLEIEAGKKVGLTEEVEDYILNYGASDASTIATALKRHRPSVATILGDMTRFCVVGRKGHTVIYDSLLSTHIKEGR